MRGPSVVLASVVSFASMIGVATLATLATFAPSASAQEPAMPTSSAADDPKSRAKAHFEQGRAHYELGRFAEALVSFEKAYEAMPLPALLFNIGQCHFQEKRYARSVFFYERYLELLPDAQNRATVEGLIAEAKKLDAETPAGATSNASLTSTSVNGAPPGEGGSDDGDDGVLWMAVAGASAVVVAAAVGVGAWALWAAPPPAGSLGLVDRRAQP